MIFCQQRYDSARTYGGLVPWETDMLFFVMYDIQSDKVRKSVASYLEKKGCQRVQQSVWLANLDRSAYDEIRSDLSEVNAMYENSDSIILCPASADELRAMDVIGENPDIGIIMKSKNTLFF